jgi:hypothetical protein
MSPLKEVGLVVTHEFKQVFLSLRSVLFFVIYGGMSFLVGSAHGKIVGFFDKKVAEKLGNISPEDLENSGMSATKAFTELFDQSPELIDVFGGQHAADGLMDGSLPVVVFVLMLLSMWFLPVLIIIIGFDRISEDLNGKFSRFIFLRLRRGTYLCGKIIAQWLCALLIIGIVHVLLLGLASTHEVFDVSQILRAAPKFWLGMTVYLMAYIAFAAVFSSTFTPPFAALALSLIAIMGMGIFSLFDEVQAFWIGDLALPLWAGAPMAYAVYLGHIALWGGLAFARLRTREI